MEALSSLILEWVERESSTLYMLQRTLRSEYWKGVAGGGGEAIFIDVSWGVL